MIQKWTFKTWLACFKDVDLPIGDLARDIERDAESPDTEDFDRLRYYFSSKGKHVLDAFIPVWDFYQSSTRPE